MQYTPAGPLLPLFAPLPCKVAGGVSIPADLRPPPRLYHHALLYAAHLPTHMAQQLVNYTLTGSPFPSTMVSPGIEEEEEAEVGAEEGSQGRGLEGKEGREGEEEGREGGSEGQGSGREERSREMKEGSGEGEGEGRDPREVGTKEGGSSGMEAEEEVVEVQEAVEEPRGLEGESLTAEAEVAGEEEGPSVVGRERGPGKLVEGEGDDGGPMGEEVKDGQGLDEVVEREEGGGGSRGQAIEISDEDPFWDGEESIETEHKAR